MTPSSRRDFLKRTAGYAAVTVPTVLALRTALKRKPLLLVTRGRSSYAIVVLPDAPLAAQQGAEDLQRHLELMSGARLPIVAHANLVARRLPPGVQPGHLITLGAAPASAPLPDDAFRLRTHGAQLEILGGGTRGTLYGCYALLEDVLGVRWFTPQVTHIPSQSTITVPALDRQEVPALEYRFPYWAEVMGQRDWLARNRVNADRLDADRGSPNGLDARTGGALYYGQGFWAHSFSTLIPPQDYPQFWTNDQLCLSDPALVPVAVARLTTAMQAEPTATMWSVSQDDNSHRCSCNRCATIEAEEGAPSGALLRFINAVAERIELVFPHVVLDTLAYQWSEVPPKVTKPRRNVRVRFAPIHACVAHVIGTCDKNRDAYTNLVGWSKLTQQLYMWHYSTNFNNYLQPLPNLTGMCGDIATFHRVGGIGLFSEGDYSSGGGGSFAELKAYVQAKLMWNPARDGRALIQEFVTGVYGTGAPFLQQWIDAIEAEVVPGNGHGARHAWGNEPPDAGYLPNSLLARGVTLFDAAEQAAAQDPPALEQIRKARLALLYVQWQRAPKGSPERTRYKVLVSDTMNHFGIRDFSEG